MRMHITPKVAFDIIYLSSFPATSERSADFGRTQNDSQPSEYNGVDPEKELDKAQE